MVIYEQKKTGEWRPLAQIQRKEIDGNPSLLAFEIYHNAEYGLTERDTIRELNALVKEGKLKIETFNFRNEILPCYCVVKS